MEKIKIKLFDKSLPLPKYHTEGSVCFDLYSRETIEIKPKEIAYIPLNVAIEPPEGYWVMMAPRSSAHKKGIVKANSIGIFDEDFCGNEDEYHFVAFNYTNKEITIEKGERIAQATLIKINKAEIKEVDEMDNQTRGGIGSTG